MNLFSFLLASTALADVYMHFPRGSNNRLNENSEVRRNGNRLFDSQNNNEGGYNVGDKFDKPAEKAEEQSKAVFFESTTEAPSELAIEWWNQHGCGRRDADDANWVNCQIVLQYMCEDSSSTKIKNGLNTNTNAYTHPGNGESVEQYRERRRRDTTDGDHGERGVHESWEYYDSCYKRDRNYGLFTGNEARVRGGAIYTRQNPGGERRGYECPEERDYYPYWHPTPWKDIAVLTSEPGKCTDLLDENGNRNMKYECVHRVDDYSTLGYSKFNNKEECEYSGGEWTGFFNSKFIFELIESEADCTAFANGSAFKDDLVWGVPYRTGDGRKAIPEENCILLEKAPDCKMAPWSRPNHLGQTDDSNSFPSYKWELPNFHGLLESQECVLRIRYNVTTNDYLDDFASDTSKGYFAGLESHDDPKVTYRGARLQLALDSAQTGRVFQDRTHVFQLKPRPTSVPSDKTIKNLGVRGRRGNIVQAFPSVEYDFSPTILEMNRDDLVHIQWEGSNSNPKSEGEGRQGTDRSNIVPITVAGASIPAGTPSFPNNELELDYFKYKTKEGTTRAFKSLIIKDSTLPEIVQQCEAAKMIPDLSEIKISHSCEHSFQGDNNRFITCEEDEILEILDAWYGRENDSICNVERGGGGLYNAPGECRRDAKWVIDGRCNGQRGCSLGFGNSYVGDPCRGTTKYLEVSYRCNKIAEAPEIEYYALLLQNGSWFEDINKNRVISRTRCWAEINEDERDTEPKMFAEWIWSSVPSIKKLNKIEELELQLASSGFYECFEKDDCDYALNENRDQLQNQLDNAAAYFAGNIVQMNPGVHQYMSTRNNNFSNRAQKGTIIVI